MNDSKLLREWFEAKKVIYVYTVTKRLTGQVTHIGLDYLVLDKRTIVNLDNVVSISDVEQFEKENKKSNNY